MGFRGLQMGSLVCCGDNSGAVFCRCVQVLKGGKVGYLGSFVSVVVCNLRVTKCKSKIRRGKVYHGLIVGLCVNFCRSVGVYVRFGGNYIVLLTKGNVPIGNRVRVPVLQELCDRFPFLGTIACCIF
jgi:ribosomal protein L14